MNRRLPYGLLVAGVLLVLSSCGTGESYHADALILEITVPSGTSAGESIYREGSVTIPRDARNYASDIDTISSSYSVHNNCDATTTVTGYVSAREETDESNDEDEQLFSHSVSAQDEVGGIRYPDAVRTALESGLDSFVFGVDIRLDEEAPEGGTVRVIVTATFEEPPLGLSM